MTEVPAELCSLSGLSSVLPKLNQALPAATGGPTPTGYEPTSGHSPTVMVHAPMDSQFEDFVKSFDETDPFSSQSEHVQTQDFPAGVGGSLKGFGLDVTSADATQQGVSDRGSKRGRRSIRHTKQPTMLVEAASVRKQHWKKPLAITLSLFAVCSFAI